MHEKPLQIAAFRNQSAFSSTELSTNFVSNQKYALYN